MMVVAIIGLLCTMAIPAFMKSRNLSQMNACINNLRQLDGAKEECALEFTWSNGTPVIDGDSNVNAYIKFLCGTTNTPDCPGGGIYTYNPIGTNPTCNIAGHALRSP